MNTRIHRVLFIIATGLVSIRCVAGADEATNASVTNATLSLTMRECVERALRNNLNIKQAQLDPTIATWGVVGAQALYDPFFSGQVNHDHPTGPERNLSSDLELTENLPWGGSLILGTSEERSYNPVTSNFTYTGGTTISASQPLLKGFGFGVRSKDIRIARKNRDIAVQDFRLQVISTISSVKNAYYDLVYAIENHKARVEDLRYAQELLDQTRRRVQIGVMSPLDVTQAESGVATRELAVILAERAILDGQNALKRLISQDVSEFRDQTIVPVNYPVVEMVHVDLAQSIRTALELRPEYINARQNVEIQNIQLKYYRNQLWPQIDLRGSYSWNGFGPSFEDFSGNLREANDGTWAVGVTVSFPLGNRSARATYQTSRLTAQQFLLALKQREQQIVVEVDNAVGHLQTNAKSVESAAVATRLAEESLKAEQSKLSAGTSTTFLVLQAQSQLAVTRTAEIRARADYNQSLVALDQAEGTTLQKENITLDETY